MAGRVYLEMAYVAPRAVLWLLLFLVGLVDGIRHRGLRSRGYQLYWALVGSGALFVLQELVLVILVAESEGQKVDRATLGAYIFFADLAASYWFGILLTVAAGYCITRTSLGPHKPVVIAIPVVYFVTALVVDYVLYWIRGFDAFTDQPTYYAEVPEDAAEKVGGTTGFMYLICLLANTMAMLLAWFFIFDTIQKEKDILEQGYPDVSAVGGTGGGTGPSSLGSRDLPVSSSGAAAGSGGDGTVGGQAVLLQDAGMANASHLYVDVVEADLDAPKTFQDKVDEREKLRLIRRFFFGVCAYLVATIAVIFLPLFVPSVVDRTILVLQNVVLWVFLAVLLWTFRMRQGSPYLLMDDEGGLETGGLVEGPTTELGVFSHEDDTDDEERAGGVTRLSGAGSSRLGTGAGPSGGPSSAMPAAQPSSAAAAWGRFTLSEEEEAHARTSTDEGGSGAGAGLSGAAARQQGQQAGQQQLGGAPPARINVEAAEQAGVVVEALPTPVTPAPMTVPGLPR